MPTRVCCCAAPYNASSSAGPAHPAACLPPLPTHLQPVLSFDLGAPVGDLAWAPFSSTVLAAVTDAGKVHVFDLAQNRGAPACTQRVARKARLTRLAFNAKHPVLLVGDEAGCVHCLKLSPNLRRSFNQGEAPLGGTRATHRAPGSVAVNGFARLAAAPDLAGMA